MNFLNKLNLIVIMVMASFTLSAFVVGVGSISVSGTREIKKALLEKQPEEKVMALIDENENSVKSASAVGFVLALFAGFSFSFIISRRLIKIGRKLFSGAQELVEFSSQLYGASEALSSSVTEQASSLQETASAVVELSSMVDMTAKNSVMSVETSKLSEDKAAEGKRIVDAVVSAIMDLNSNNKMTLEHVESSNQSLAEIVRIIGGIKDKTKVINEIVFQSRLLSFNASIEAARAGEQGKGFGVVAEEVGKLARISGEAAEEMSNLIKVSIEKVQSIVDETKSKVGNLVVEGSKKVEQTTSTARQCEDVLEKIVLAASQARSKSSEISQASEEQSSGIKGITQAISELEQSTHENATSATQSADIASRLDSHAVLLKAEVEELFRAVRGGWNSSKRAG